MSRYLDEDEKSEIHTDPDAVENESPLTYEAGPGFFLPVGTGPKKASRLAREAGVMLWWNKRTKFIEEGKPYEDYFGRTLEEINPALLDEDGIPIPSIYTGTTIWGKTISATPITENAKATRKENTGLWKPSVAKPIPSIQCTKIKPDGAQCGNWALRGASVCVSHGGKLPVVRAHAEATVEAARLRLIDMADSAVGVLEDLITSVGTADAIRLKAATEVLDRSGVRGGLDLTMEVEHKVTAEDAVAERFAEIFAREEAARKREEEAELLVIEDIEDAEVEE